MCQTLSISYLKIGLCGVVHVTIKDWTMWGGAFNY